jgi:hypothetical protein
MSIEANQHTFTAEPDAPSFSEIEDAATELAKTTRKPSLAPTRTKHRRPPSYR